MAILTEYPVRMRTFIRAEADRVFDALTGAQGWDTWFTQGMEVDARPGGRIVFRWEQFGPDLVTCTDRGTVQELRRPDLFVFIWHPAGDDAPTVVRIELKEAYGGTVVTLTDSGFPDTDQGRAALVSCAAGWGEALTLLKFYLEYGVVYRSPEVPRHTRLSV